VDLDGKQSLFDSRFSGTYFDAASVELDFAFIESLTLTKSTRSGTPEPFVMMPFQKKLIGNLLGWKRPDGSRLYRTGFLTVARKNTKTQTVGALALDLLVMDPEPYQEIYAAAKTSEQAEKLYLAASEMVMAHEELPDLLQIIPYRREIRHRTNGGMFKALTSEGKAKHGSNPSTILYDEFHVWGAREEELRKALRTGRGARRQPLEVYLTTAGVDEETMCFREQQYARDILAGIMEDPTYFPMIYEVPKDADWTDRDLWYLANPALGVTVSMDFLNEEFVRAMNSPHLQTEFRQLYLNQWVNSKSSWIPLQKFDLCGWDGARPVPAL
jgi:phage terminase large subunit-like protein